MNHTIRTLIAVACGAAFCVTGLAQTPPVTMLEIDLNNSVMYVEDVSDMSKWGKLPGPVPPAADYTHPFKWRTTIADIVAVNGRPVKGSFVLVQKGMAGITDFTPGRPISDVQGTCVRESRLILLQPDGTAIGSMIVSGSTTLMPPPGAPNVEVSPPGMEAVVAGTGAFLGARGHKILAGSSRVASVTEDAAYRRINGGNKLKIYIHLIPMTWPEVLTVPTGPAIFHADDFSPVTTEKPARAGELLMMSVSGLGPVRPNLDPGKPFPAWQAGKEHVVNSPVEVTVNGKAAAVTSAIGWPGMNNVYRVDFRVPEGTAAGTATLGLSVAWINGPEVKIPVR
ncbi:MAG: hypothetical protein FJW34_15930 [Acidobacteria bacterium]|nr:hypothetical protein [Acidobacteriota bacterium]